MTPDPYQASGGPSDPQSWNRYAYTRGDPVNRYDPWGTQDTCSGVCQSFNPIPGQSGLGDQNYGASPGVDRDGGIIQPWNDPVGQKTVIPFKPVIDPNANKWARGVLSKAFTSFAGSNCDKDFAAIIPHYNTQLFENYSNVANFYYAASADAGLTQNQVSGNGSSTTLGSTLPLGTTAVTLTTAQGAVSPAILLGNGILNFQGAGSVLIHELLHAFTNWSDATIYQDFANYGLVNPGDGSTSAISRWISTDCKSTPPDSAP
jgi:hypothetical protein